MLLVPFQRVTIDSSLDPIALHAALVESRAERLWWGTVKPNTFRLTRRIKGRNTYNPWLLGEFIPEGNGTRISVIYTLHPVALIFMLGMIGWIEYLALRANDPFWIPLAIFAAFHALMYFIGFVPDLRRSDKLLRSIARGERPSRADLDSVQEWFSTDLFERDAGDPH